MLKKIIKNFASTYDFNCTSDIQSARTLRLNVKKYSKSASEMFVPPANALMQLLLIGEIVNNAAKQQLMTWRDHGIYTSESRQRISRIASVFVWGWPSLSELSLKNISMTVITNINEYWRTGLFRTTNAVCSAFNLGVQLIPDKIIAPILGNHTAIALTGVFPPLPQHLSQIVVAKFTRTSLIVHNVHGCNSSGTCMRIWKRFSVRCKTLR